MNDNIERVLKSIRDQDWFKDLIQRINIRSGCISMGLPRSTRLPVLAAVYQEIRQPILLITNRADHANQLTEELAIWLSSSEIHHFSEPTPLFYEQAGWGQNSRIERIKCLNALASLHLPSMPKPENPPVIVTSTKSVMIRTLPRHEFLKAMVRIKVGDSHILKQVQDKCVQMGYQPAETVLIPGDFSQRGGLLDIWPAAYSKPLRLDFFGNEIESIRRFDPTNQMTIENIQEVNINPMREFLLPMDPEKDGSDGREINEFDIPVLHPFADGIFEYLPEKSLIFTDDLLYLSNLVADYEMEGIKLRQEGLEEGTLSESHPIPYLTWTEISESLSTRQCVDLGKTITDDVDEEDEQNVFKLGPLNFFEQEQRFAGQLKAFNSFLETIAKDENLVLVSSRQSERLSDLWEEEQEHTELGHQPMFLDTLISEGWKLRLDDGAFIHIITDSEIFGWTRPFSRRKLPFHIDAPETSCDDLAPGDWVVHVDYGIGRFSGLVERTLDGIKREFISISYKNGDEVYVPIHQADRITRYLGASGNEPSLDNLGTQDWQETKRKVKQAVQEVASDLLNLYSMRQTATGFAFSHDSTWQEELENSFPYFETSDQLNVIKDVKADMESTRPMDRLLCGDVGYGKTEVALRAAFKAAMDDKQVALLVPTTVLAQQHLETFQQRLAAFPVKVDMLSRFRSAKEISTTLNGLAEGSIDIVIGTHRLIQPDVQFKDLGLVIIDEEQRFGVTHKEHLKKLRNEVDVLTLTATPIPRTLYMALTGVRDISQLSTPPDERLPVVTHIGPYSPQMVRHAILREMERGGQVFFVHNRVQTIDSMKMHLQHLVPEARIAIGHGQMPEHQLEQVMHDFTSGIVDVLLSTSIIESGLDIPNANTLIVDRGDAFGLAQLYQLRGRVGRGAVRAYAYFFRHNKRLPSLDGQERLDIIAENTQLGSGYSIAMRDLEMRGAGEILGTRQHGYISSVGFHLYTRMLSSAVRSQQRAKGITIPETDQPMFREISMPVNVELPLATGIPAEYIPEQKLRFQLYRRLADVEDDAALDLLIKEFNDRFGPIPPMVMNLFYQLKVKLLAESAGLSSVTMDSQQIVLRFPPVEMSETPVNGKKPGRMLPELGEGVRTGKNAYWLIIGKDSEWQDKLMAILLRLQKS